MNVLFNKNSNNLTLFIELFAILSKHGKHKLSFVSSLGKKKKLNLLKSEFEIKSSVYSIPF